MGREFTACQDEWDKLLSGVMDVQILLDQAHELVRRAGTAVLDDQESDGVLLSSMCLETQGLLEQAGARPGIADLEIPDSPRTQLEHAAAMLDDIPVDSRPFQLGEARASLTELLQLIG